jgi:hypothetical protein
MMLGESLELLIGFAERICFLVCTQAHLYGRLNSKLLQHLSELGVRHQCLTSNGSVDALHQLLFV